MNANWSAIQNKIGLGLITTGLLWAAALPFQIQAQQSAAASDPTAVTTPLSNLRLENGKRDVRQLSGPLTDAVNRWAAATTHAEWLGYSVAEVTGHRSVCCQNWGRDGSDGCGK